MGIHISLLLGIVFMALVLVTAIGGVTVLISTVRSRPAVRAVLGLVGTLSALLVLMAVAMTWLQTSRPHVARPYVPGPSDGPRLASLGAGDPLAGPAESPGGVVDALEPPARPATPSDKDATGSAPAPTAADESTGPLSEPDSRTPRDAPRWVTEPLLTTDRAARMVVTAGPHARLLDCNRELDEQLIAAAKRYIGEHIDPSHPGLIDISPAFIRQNVVTEVYVETTTHTFGDMYTIHLLLEFDREDHHVLLEQSRRAVVHSRLWYAGFGLGSLLALVSTLFGYLRIDEATGGRYKGRLMLASGAVILALLVAARLLVKFIALA